MQEDEGDDDLRQRTHDKALSRRCRAEHSLRLLKKSGEKRQVTGPVRTQASTRYPAGNAERPRKRGKEKVERHLPSKR